MDPDYYVIIDARGVPLDVVRYYDQACVRVTELTTTKTTARLLPVFTATTLDDHLAEILGNRLMDANTP